MGMPALEGGPYIFNVNNLFSESNVTDKQKRWKLEIKNALVAVGGAGVIWAVTASSDSSSYVNKGGGSPDLWTDISDIVGNSAGNPHSWCILENQFTGGELLFDTASTNNYQCNIRYSPAGLYGTGDASNAPTATDDQELADIAYHCTSVGVNYTKIVVHVMVSADYKTTRFYVHEKDNISGDQGGFIGMIEEVVDTPSQWTSTNKTVVLAQLANVNYSDIPLGQSPYIADLQGAFWKAYLETADPYAGWLSCYPVCECYGDFSNNGANALFWNSENLEVQGGVFASPIGLFKSSDPYGGSYGRLRDIYIPYLNFDTLSQFPNDETRAWIKIGCFLLPWNGTIPVNIS